LLIFKTDNHTKQHNMKNSFTMLRSGTLAAALITLQMASSAFAQTERNAAYPSGETTRLGSPISVMPQPVTPCGRVNMLNQLRLSDTDVTLSWNNASTADSFRVVLTQESNGASQSRTVSGLYHYAAFTGLLPMENYKWYVMSFCQGSSTASASMKFTTPSSARLQNIIRNPSLTPMCPGLGTTTIADVSHDKGIIDWTSRATFDSIHVRFNATGSLITKTITITGTPANSRYVLSGLSELTSYDVTLSTFCGNGVQSTWSNTLTFTTLRAPGPRFQAASDDFSMKLLPNPATTETKVVIESAGTGTCHLNIYDITGKEKMSKVIEISESVQGTEIDLTTLPKGIYLVKVKNNSKTSVQRLIIN
jgi:hypothetical protein